MINENSTLGERIRYFRKRANLSQMQLELEINAAPSTISRTEHNQVNPTKETLKNIAAVLKLNSIEKSFLFDLFTIFPTQLEIENAINEVSNYFAKSDVLAYLLDEWTHTYAVSKGMEEMLHLTAESKQRLFGKTMMEITFDPANGMKQLFEPSHFIEMSAMEFARNRSEFDINYLSDVIEKLMHFPDFRQAMELSKSYNGEFFSAQSKTAYFQFGEQKVKMNYSREKLKRNPRFEVIEFINPQPY